MCGWHAFPQHLQPQLVRSARPPHTPPPPGPAQTSVRRPEPWAPSDTERGRSGVKRGARSPDRAWASGLSPPLPGPPSPTVVRLLWAPPPAAMGVPHLLLPPSRGPGTRTASPSFPTFTLPAPPGNPPSSGGPQRGWGNDKAGRKLSLLQDPLCLSYPIWKRQILSSLRGPVFSLLTAFKGSHLIQGKTHHPSVHRPTVPPSATGPDPSSLPPLTVSAPATLAFSLLLRQGKLILTSGPLHVLFLVLECLSLGFRTTASSSVIQMRGKRGKVLCHLQHILLDLLRGSAVQSKPH